MSNTVYAKTSQFVTPETPGQRNRRLFIKALSAGVSVVKDAPEGYYVNSATKPGTVYLVQLDASDDGQNIIACTCEWGCKYGWMRDSTSSPMCSHMTIVRWYRSDDATKAHTIALHPEIANAISLGNRIAASGHACPICSNTMALVGNAIECPACLYFVSVTRLQARAFENGLIDTAIFRHFGFREVA